MNITHVKTPPDFNGNGYVTAGQTYKILDWSISKRGFYFIDDEGIYSFACCKNSIHLNNGNWRLQLRHDK